jgi:dTDP-glucose 4,6-dehydratase
MKVLITGGAGFVGHHMVETFLVKGCDVTVIDSFRHRGCSTRVGTKEKIILHDLKAPIPDRLDLDVEYIVNCASESHVDRSISDPVTFTENNVSLMLNMLEFARKQKNLRGFFQVSTDEVYGPAWHNSHHEEWDPIIPSNPYAASKAAQEAIAISYWRTYNLPLVITNTMNMIGERQDPEKFIPLVINKALRNEIVTVHGTQKRMGSRYYLYVKDFADAIYFLMKNDYPRAKYKDNGESARPDRFNVVGREELTNLDVVNEIARVLNRPIATCEVDFHAARPGHDRRYALSSKKLDSEGWSAKTDIREAIQKTVNWYLENPNWLK